ncbi:MAG: glutathione S-transferase family protein [Burkholderiales bacterium]|nr:glutathione S-transferase family protein [Burkholderiales bacterium]
MTELTLYHNDMSVCSAKVRMTLAEKALEWESVHLDLRAGDAQAPEYVALNPNQVVPTLLHGGRLVPESTVICEYLDDVRPDPPLRGADPHARAQMRLWTKRLDEGAHAAAGMLSLCVAFREQHLDRDPDALRRYLAAMVDAARRERIAQALEFAMDAPGFAPALARWQAIVADMDAALARGRWLAGEACTLADIAYAPYLARLEHLGLDDMVRARPRVAEWWLRLAARPAFQEGVTRWFNPAYLALFERQRERARAHARRVLGGDR